MSEKKSETPKSNEINKPNNESALKQEISTPP